MSIPSLMTATLPHNSHLSQQRYNPSPTLGTYHHSLQNGSQRLATSHSFPQHTASTSRQPNYSNSRQLPPLRNMPPSNSASQVPYTQKQERKPDWDEFYKNGPPKEIIVIDDDESPPPATKRKATRSKPEPQARAGAQQPMAKKRKTAYDAARDYYGSASYSKPAYSPEDSSNTASSGRTNSLHTTAATSLTSHTSHGSAAAYVDDIGVGQKRKRVTRQQIATERRRQEANNVETYVPPPKPPIKAKDVHVPTLRDVSWRCENEVNSADGQKVYTHGQPVDDEDGHYLVNPQAGWIGDRCKLRAPHFRG